MPLTLNGVLVPVRVSVFEPFISSVCKVSTETEAMRAEEPKVRVVFPLVDAWMANSPRFCFVVLLSITDWVPPFRKKSVDEPDVTVAPELTIKLPSRVVVPDEGRVYVPVPPNDKLAYLTGVTLAVTPVYLTVPNLGAKVPLTVNGLLILLIVIVYGEVPPSRVWEESILMDATRIDEPSVSVVFPDVDA